MNVLTPATFQSAASRMVSGCDRIRAAVDRYGLPPFWHRPEGFATLSLFIVEQQVSLDSAKAVFERLVTSVGEVRPDTLLSAGADTLGRAGLTRQKQRYLRELAGAVHTGILDLEVLADRPDEEARRSLQQIPGIGRWTADIYLLSALRRPDIWPVGDRALQVGAGEVLGMADPPTATELEEIGERWRPYRSVAARVVWHAYLTRRNRKETEVVGLHPITGGGAASHYRSGS